jgi:carbon-monoxide dehydrogenase large subunit
MAGNAVHLAGQMLRGKILDVAAGYLDTEAANLELRGGRVYRKGEQDGAPVLDLEDVVRLAETGSRFDVKEPGLEATEYFRIEDWTYSYGTHVAHVAVDAETGKLDILRYVVVEDVGRCVNPLTMHGQSVGGAAQGIGGTILEELVYGEDGQLLAGSLVDYLLPTSRDIPNIESVILEESPSPLNPLGVKGAGEGAILATGAALANAVANALGVQMTELPLSPNNIRKWAKHRQHQA